MIRFKMSLRFLVFFCILSGTCIGLVGEKLFTARRQQIAANRILSALRLVATHGKYNVFWYDGIVRISDPKFGDAEFLSLITPLREFPGHIDLDLRESAVTSLGLSPLKEVHNIAMIRLCSDSFSDKQSHVLELELKTRIVCSECSPVR